MPNDFSRTVARRTREGRAGTTIVPGTVLEHPDTGQLVASIQGRIVAAEWLDGITVAAGDGIAVAVTDGGPDGQSSALVLGRRFSGPRPGEGQVTAVPAGSATITVDVEGVSYTARFGGSYTPTVGDNVLLVWQGGAPVVLDEVGVIPPPAPEDAPPPPVTPAPPPSAPQTGTSTFTAIDSGTWDPGNGVWSTYYRKNVLQGTAGGYTSQGLWFYGNAPTGLKGRTVTRVRLRYGARKRVGSYNSAAVIHFYKTANRVKSGAPGFQAGPHDLLLPVNAPAGYIDLPIGWGQSLVDTGGGIGIKDNPYAGFAGVEEDPESGKLIIDWRR